MEYSQYNILFNSSKNEYLIYNSLSNGFLQLDKELYSKLLLIKKGNKNTTDELPQDIIDELIANKILTESKLDDYYEIKLSRHLARYQKKHLSLTIAPTLNCNFRCTYCFEEGFVKKTIDQETIDNIIDLIKDSDAKTLSVTWYGGEPLLSFKSIKSITERIKKLQVKYFASIITNGYLLTPEKVNLFEDLKIIDIQLTLDGDKHIHDNRRPFVDGSGTFSTIIKNIDYLHEKFTGKIKIRVNIDEFNKNHYGLFYKKMKDRFPKAYIYPGFVTKDFDSCNSVGDCSFSHTEKAKFKIYNHKKHKIFNGDIFPSNANRECMARCVNSFLIDPFGRIYKCWEHIGKEKFVIGNINNKGNGLKSGILTRYLTSADPFENLTCQNCNLLPICSGGCPNHLVSNLYAKSNYDTCTFFKDNIEEFLELYYKNKVQKNG